MQAGASEGALRAVGLSPLLSLGNKSSRLGESNTTASLLRAAATKADEKPSTADDTALLTRPYTPSEGAPVAPQATFPDQTATPDPVGEPLAERHEPSGEWTVVVGFQYDRTDLNAVEVGRPDVAGVGGAQETPLVSGWAVGAVASRSVSDDGFAFGYATYRDQEFRLPEAGSEIRQDEGLDIGVGYGHEINPGTMALATAGTDGFRVRLSQVF